MIPDSLKIAEVITNNICPKGAIIKLDYSHIACLQSSKKDESDVLVKVSSAYINMVSKGLLTVEEARMEIAKYIDIDPDKPKGELKGRISDNSENNGKEESKDE